MRIHLLLAAVSLAGLASPALAQDEPLTERLPAERIDPERAAALLSNPMVQAGAADVLTQLANVLLDTRVGPLAALARRPDRLAPDDTLGDVIRRDDPDFDRRLRSDTRRALAVAGNSATAALGMTRELERTARRLRQVLDRVPAE